MSAESAESSQAASGGERRARGDSNTRPTGSKPAALVHLSYGRVRRTVAAGMAKVQGRGDVAACGSIASLAAVDTAGMRGEGAQGTD